MAKKNPRSVTEFDKRLGEKLREMRKARGITQQTLAKRLGVTFQQIQKYEFGMNRLCVERLLKIAEALGTPYAELIP